MKAEEGKLKNRWSLLSLSFLHRTQIGSNYNNVFRLSFLCTGLKRQQLTVGRYHSLICQSIIGEGALTILQADEKVNISEELRNQTV